MVNITRAAFLLLEARQSGVQIEQLPLECAPKTLDDAYAIQDIQIAQLGPVAGWKASCPPGGQEVLVAPVFKNHTYANGASLDVQRGGPLFVEVEVGYHVMRDIGPNDSLPSESSGDIICLPMIEILGGRYINIEKLAMLDMVADCIANDAFVFDSERRRGFVRREIYDGLEVDIDGHRFDYQILSYDLQPFEIFSRTVKIVAERGFTFRAGDFISTGSIFTPGLGSEMVSARWPNGHLLEFHL